MRTAFSILLAIILLSVTVPAQDKVTVKWLFEIKEGLYTPQGKVYLLVGNRKILILSGATEFYQIIEPKDYKVNKIPASALTACSGWWAGQGKDFYVLRRQRQLIVYWRILDEGAPVWPYKRLKTIRL